MSTIKASRQPVQCHTTTSPVWTWFEHRMYRAHFVYTLSSNSLGIVYIKKASEHIDLIVVWPFLFGSCSSSFLWTAKSFSRDKPIERPLHGQMQLWSNRTCHWSSEASLYGRVFNEHNRLLGHWSACKQRSRRDSVPAYQLHSHVNSHAQSVKKAVIIIEESQIQSTLQFFKSFCQKR